MKKTILILCALLITLSVMADGGSIKTVRNCGFKRAINRAEVQLVDVRTAEEHAQSYIYVDQKTTLNMDVKSESFGELIKTLDKTKPVAVYCKGGGRSMKASEKLRKEGFRVINLKKGFDNWRGDRATSAVSAILD